MAKVIKLGQYKNIEVEVELRQITDEQVDHEIETLLKQNPVVLEKEGTVENGDVTVIDFEGFKDGVPFEGGKAEGFELTIGSGQFIPGFEEQMVGMEKGETRDLNVTFPKNYHAEELAGAPVVFKVTVHNILTKKEAELTDEFVAGMGNPLMKTVEEFKSAMRTYLEDGAKQERERLVEDQAFGKLVEESEVELDEADIEDATNKQIQVISQQMMQQGIQLEQYLQMLGMTQESLREQLRPNSMNQAKYMAIIDEIAKIETLGATEEEIDSYFEPIMQSTKQTKEELLQGINYEEFIAEFARFKASRFVIDHVIVK